MTYIPQLACYVGCKRHTFVKFALSITCAHLPFTSHSSSSRSRPLTPRGFTFAETFALLLGLARHELMQSEPNGDARSLPFQLRDFFGKDRAELTGLIAARECAIVSP